MPVVHLEPRNKISSTSLMDKFGLSVGSDGKVLASDVEALVLKLEEAFAEQRAQLEKIVEIKDHKKVCDLEFAKICGNIEFILEEFSLDTIVNGEVALKKSNNVVNFNILSK